MKPYNPQIAIPTLKAFIYGDSGTGKTTLLASAMDDPRTSPMLMLTCAGNPESIRRRTNLPTILELEATSELNPIYDWIAAGQPASHPFVEQLKSWGHVYTTPFKSIALDSVTEYQRIALDEITGNRTKRIGDDLKAPDRQQWGQALARLTRVARLLFKLDVISVFMTALEKREVEEATGMINIRPSLWGQADGEVPSYALLMIRLMRVSAIPIVAERKKHEGKHNIGYVNEATKFLAKDQYGGVPDVLPAPTIPDIMNYAYGAI